MIDFPKMTMEQHSRFNKFLRGYLEEKLIQDPKHWANAIADTLNSRGVVDLCGYNHITDSEKAANAAIIGFDPENPKGEPDMDDVQALTRNHPDFHRVLDYMTTRGGGFARALAGALAIADSENTARILDAFPDMFRRYLGEVRHKAPLAMSSGPRYVRVRLSRKETTEVYLKVPEGWDPHDSNGGRKDVLEAIDKTIGDDFDWDSMGWKDTVGVAGWEIISEEESAKYEVLDITPKAP